MNVAICCINTSVRFGPALMFPLYPLSNIWKAPKGHFSVVSMFAYLQTLKSSATEWVRPVSRWEHQALTELASGVSSSGHKLKGKVLAVCFYSMFFIHLGRAFLSFYQSVIFSASCPCFTLSYDSEHNGFGARSLHSSPCPGSNSLGGSAPSSLSEGQFSQLEIRGKNPRLTEL